ncbi:GNAT family N-acetyltransferase [Shewanella waksmanii]|uniref:GNAT family N-acetyltransferase n=1 Tax=Shewanella waksmanii TaxID=213783 RepID=UPI00048EA5F7|nr:GNAT family protein [Shewanella waksmanii]
MIELYTDRLKIRSLDAQDWDDFLLVHQDPVVNKFVRRPDSLPELQDKFCQRLAPWEFDSGNWLMLVIEEVHSGNFVGFTGFYANKPELGHVEVGYMLSPRMQGKGYASESLEAVVDWACLQFAVHKFVGVCAKDNLASSKVLEKCGFQLEGVLRDNIRLDDAWVDDCYYGLLASERAQ